MTKWVGIVALAVGMAATACSNEVNSSLEVNGKAWKPSDCRSGAIYGFRGVELSGDGMSIRIAATITGEAQVVVTGGAEKGANGAIGTDLGKCGTFSIADQSSTINDVKNVEGKAVLDCKNDEMTIHGSVAFSNCH